MSVQPKISESGQIAEQTAPVVSVPAHTTADAGRTAGIDLYERANDARRSGDHDGYNRLVRELIAYNALLPAAKTGGAK